MAKRNNKRGPFTRGKRKKVAKSNGKLPKGHKLFPSTGMPQYTLLDIPDAVPLPDLPPAKGRPFTLPDIVKLTPHIYAKLITFIRCGASGNAAAEVVGICEKTFYEWCHIGSLEMAQDPAPDTYYTRFFNDIRRAVAVKRSELEIEIAATDPKKWLSHGPGRIFGDNWRDTPGIPIPQPDILNGPTMGRISSSPGRKQIENKEPDYVEGEFVSIQIDENTTIDALKVLEENDVVEVSRSYKSQVKKQRGNSDD